jgi:hypothetical protein
MEIQELGSIGELIAGVATIITLIYLATQIRQNTNISKTTNFLGLSSEVNHFSRMIAQDPELNDLYVRGCKDFTSLDENEKSRFNMIFSVLIHPYQSMYIIAGRGQMDEELMRNNFEILSSLFQQPGARQWWEASSYWWDPEFGKFVRTVWTDKK